MPTYLNKLLHIPEGGDDVKHYIYIKTEWEETEIKFLLSVSAFGMKTYKGTLAVVDLEEAAKDLDKQYDEFYNECKAALTADISLPGFVYEIDASKPQFVLINLSNGFKINYLEVNLHEMPNNCELLDTAFEWLTVKQQETTVNSSDKNSSQLLHEYQNYVEGSKRLERKLLKKFILLINSKKAKITELEKELDLVRRNATDDNDDSMNQDTDVESVPNSPDGSMFGAGGSGQPLHITDAVDEEKVDE